ncbi:hypothetical protein ABPG74_018940 [Tetrahymena malaccensis]
MRLSVFVLLALVAIATAETKEPANGTDIDALIESCYGQIGYACKNGTKEENKACKESYDPIQECVFKCKKENEGKLQNMLECYQSDCQSENTDVQSYFGKLYTCLNGISILAFTVAASALALLL